MNTTKQQALERLTALETEAKSLRAILEAPEQATSLLSVPKMGERYWSICGGQFSLYPDGGCDRSAPRDAGYINTFTSKAQCEAYAKAFTTMLRLRHQPGSEAAVEGKDQWSIHNKDGELVCYRWNTIDMKSILISPCFSTKAHTEAAIKAVGEDRIKRCFQTLHGVMG